MDDIRQRVLQGMSRPSDQQLIRDPLRPAPNLYWYHPEAVGVNDLTSRRIACRKKD